MCVGVTSTVHAQVQTPEGGAAGPREREARGPRWVNAGVWQAAWDRLVKQPLLTVGVGIVRGFSCLNSVVFSQVSIMRRW
jgi:hypothetical protein